MHIDEHREKKLSCGDSPSVTFIYVPMWVEKAANCYKKVSNLYAAFWLILHVNIDKRESKKI